MAENKLYDIHHGEGSSDSPCSPPSRNAEDITVLDPPPEYSPPQPHLHQQPADYPPQPEHGQHPHYPLQSVPQQPQSGQPRYSPQDPEPAGQQPYYPPEPQSGPGYAPGYQRFDNPLQTTTTIMMPPQACTMQVPTAKPDLSYLVLAILSAIFCCPLFGIIGIVYASQIESAYARGDYLRATSNASAARGWTLAAFVCGLISLTPFIVFIVVGFPV